MPQKTWSAVTGVDETAEVPKQMLTKAEYIQNMAIDSATYIVAGKQKYHHPTLQRMFKSGPSAPSPY